jgi:hypothetical protein
MYSCQLLAESIVRPGNLTLYSSTNDDRKSRNQKSLHLHLFFPTSKSSAHTLRPMHCWMKERLSSTAITLFARLYSVTKFSVYYANACRPVGRWWALRFWSYYSAASIAIFEFAKDVDDLNMTDTDWMTCYITLLIRSSVDRSSIPHVRGTWRAAVKVRSDGAENSLFKWSRNLCVRHDLLEAEKGNLLLLFNIQIIDIMFDCIITGWLSFIIPCS